MLRRVSIRTPFAGNAAVAAQLLASPVSQEHFGAAAPHSTEPPLFARQGQRDHCMQRRFVKYSSATTMRLDADGANKKPSSSGYTVVQRPAFLRHYADAIENTGMEGDEKASALPPSDTRAATRHKAIRFDPCPVVLIDRSGSTGSRSSLCEENSETKGEGPRRHERYGNVLAAEKKVAADLLISRGIDSCVLGFWDTDFDAHGVTATSKLKDFSVTPRGGTNLTQALHFCERHFASLKEGDVLPAPKDVYIVTDGEIFDPDRIAESIRSLTARGVNFYLLTVEANGTNYYEADCGAGNTLVRFLQENNHMNCVREMTLYNDFHSTGFTSLANYRVPDGMVPFDDCVFFPRELPQFLSYIEEVIAAIKSNNDDSATRPILLKLSHQLTRTVFYLTKGYVPQVGRILADKIVRLFLDTPVYEQVRSSFVQEVSNHVHGKSSTFQGYRRTRETTFENAQIDLFKQTQQAVLPENARDETKTYISFVVNDTIAVADQDSGDNSLFDSDLFGDVHLGGDRYKYGGLRFDKHTLPCFAVPSAVANATKTTTAGQSKVLYEVTDDDAAQNLRQWARANYSRLYRMRVVSSKIIAQAFVDCFRLHRSVFAASPSDQHTAAAQKALNGYRYLLSAMLRAPIFGNDARSIRDELMDGKHMKGFEHISTLAKELKVTPGALWYACLVAYGDEALLKAQDVVYVPGTGNKQTGQEEALQQVRTASEALADTATVTVAPLGRTLYLVEPHDIFDGLPCPATETPHKDRCATCGGTKVEIRAPPSTDKKQHKLPRRHPIYADDNLQTLSLEPESFHEGLTSIDKLEWPRRNYDVTNPMVRDVLNSARLEVYTLAEFKEAAYKRFPFLEDLDMTNVTLAGGFVRSILLGQKLKDFDFFFYGLEDPYERMVKLLKDLIPAVLKHQPSSLDGKTKFLYMYKPTFNVFEIIHVTDPTNHFDESFFYDNFKSYTYKTMRHFGKVFAKPDRSYFEDNDAKGIRILNRFQFVMAKNPSLSSLVQGFDLAPCCVAFTGDDVLFAPAAFTAYKYMVNVVDPSVGTNDLYDYRIGKYFTYGFDIVFPKSALAEDKPAKGGPYSSAIGDQIRYLQSSSSTIDSSTEGTITLGSLRFRVHSVDGNRLFVRHNSHKDEMVANQEELEQQQQQTPAEPATSNGGTVALYKSTLFPNLVGVMRYMCIQKINYLFSAELVLPDNETRMFPFTKSRLPKEEDPNADLVAEATVERQYSRCRNSFPKMLKKWRRQIEDWEKDDKLKSVMPTIKALDTFGDEGGKGNVEHLWETVNVSGRLKRKAIELANAEGVSCGPCKLEFRDSIGLDRTQKHAWFGGTKIV